MRSSSGEGLRKAGDMEDEDKTADASTSGKTQEKSDADASKEVAVGEQGISKGKPYMGEVSECHPYVPKPFTVEELMNLSGKAHYFAGENRTNEFFERAYMRFADATVDLATRLAYAEAIDKRCAIEGCENPAYAPIEVTISKEEGQTGFILQVEDVRACKPCIKQYGLTIKKCEAYNGHIWL